MSFILQVKSCVGCFLVGLLVVTNGGLYVFLLLDYYASYRIPVMFFAIVESLCEWMDGAERYYDDIKDMIGYRPSPYMKYCWKFVICTCTLVLSLIKFTPLKYNTYRYPWWGYLRIFFAFSSTALIPLWVIYILTATPGTLRQRLNAKNEITYTEM